MAERENKIPEVLRLATILEPNFIVHVESKLFRKDSPFIQVLQEKHLWKLHYVNNTIYARMLPEHFWPIIHWVRGPDPNVNPHQSREAQLLRHPYLDITDRTFIYGYARTLKVDRLVKYLESPEISIIPKLGYFHNDPHGRTHMVCKVCAIRLWFRDQPVVGTQPTIENPLATANGPGTANAPVRPDPSNAVNAHATIIRNQPVTQDPRAIGYLLTANTTPTWDEPARNLKRRSEDMN